MRGSWGSDLAMGKKGRVLVASTERMVGSCAWEEHRSGSQKTQTGFPALTLSDHVTYSNSLTSLSSPYTSVKYHMPWSYLPTGMRVETK